MEKAGVVIDATSGSVASACAAVCLGAVCRAAETTTDSPRGQPGECRPTEVKRWRRDANCIPRKAAGRKGTGKRGTGLGQPQSGEETLQGETKVREEGSPGSQRCWMPGLGFRILREEDV